MEKGKEYIKNGKISFEGEFKGGKNGQELEINIMINMK